MYVASIFFLLHTVAYWLQLLPGDLKGNFEIALKKIVSCLAKDL
jgi:hypothetical protein